MALPASLRTSVTPAELELVAGNEQVVIEPSFRMDETKLLSGPKVGPFIPPRLATVPLWLAVTLKMKKKCRIVPPPWLNVDYLQERLNLETSQPQFSVLPFRFAEISKILLDVAPDDMGEIDKLQSLLKDLREARQAKSREGLGKLDHIELSLPNLCAMEIAEIREVFVQSMDIFAKLTRPDDSMAS